VERLIAACAGLTQFPERGMAQDDIAPGIRILGFERRVVIAYRVRAGEVEIVRVLYGGRDLDRAFNANDGQT
jgi:toxin ParE1/3/4